MSYQHVWVKVASNLAQVQATDMLETAKSGYEYRLEGTTWLLLKKRTQPILLMNQASIDSAEMRSVRNLFHVQSAIVTAKPKNAHVAIQYKGYWFYIDDKDQASKSTFSLLMELARLELAGNNNAGPVLTLPVGSH